MFPNINNRITESVSSIKIEKTNMNTLKKTIERLYARAEREIPEYGSFSLVSENVEAGELVSDKIGNLVFVIRPNEDKKYTKERIMEIKVATPSKKSSASMIISLGSKEQIMKKLKKETLCEDVQKFINTCAEKFEENNYI